MFAIPLAALATASATVMVEVTLEDMARDADAVVVGVVERTGVRMVMLPDGMEPHSITRVRVRSWIKGSGGDSVVIDELGGVHAQGGMWIDGTPEYRTGEEVVVFLERRPDDPSLYRTYGMAQGKFLIMRGVPGVPDTVEHDVSAVGFARWADGRMQVVPGRNGPAMELEGFLDVVRAAVALGRAE
jgi:hypothetical protein